MVDSLRDRLLHSLGEQEETVIEALTRAAGGEDLCVLERSGRISGGAKYEEGRFTALRDCRTAFYEYPEADNHDELRDLLESVRARWSKLLEHHRRQNPPGLSWVAYAQGGHDLCDEALNQLHRVALRDG